MRYAATFSLILIVGLGCVTAPRTDNPGSLLPGDGFEPGWRMVGDIELFDTDNLFEHINGEAELYMPYGFRNAIAGFYECGDDSFMLDIYEMGSPLDAFGIYSNYRGEGVASVDIGAGGFLSGTQLMFYKGARFVRLDGVGDVASLVPAMKSCAKAVATLLPGNNDSPSELSLLNVSGVRPNSVSYCADSVIGYQFFPRGLLGESEISDRDYRFFVLLFDTSQEAMAAVENYTAYLADYDAAYDKDVEGDVVKLMAADPLHKHVILRVLGTRILGAASRGELDVALPILDDIEKRLHEK